MALSSAGKINILEELSKNSKVVFIFYYITSNKKLKLMQFASLKRMIYLKYAQKTKRKTSFMFQDLGRMVG